jgi:hypothetical protein
MGRDADVLLAIERGIIFSSGACSLCFVPVSRWNDWVMRLMAIEIECFRPRSIDTP